MPGQRSAALGDHAGADDDKQYRPRLAHFHVGEVADQPQHAKRDEERRPSHPLCPAVRAGALETRPSLLDQPNT